MNFGKSKKPKSKLKYNFVFLDTPLIHKSIKNIKKTMEILSSPLSESIPGFTNLKT